MNMDPQFPWWILANAIGGVLTLAAFAAFTPVIRYIVRRLTSTLPEAPDTERVREELEGMAAEMRAEERLVLAASLLLNISRLHDEFAARAAGTPLIEDMGATVGPKRLLHRQTLRRRRHHHHHHGRTAERTPVAAF
jgi:hypothetical protein